MKNLDTASIVILILTVLVLVSLITILTIAVMMFAGKPTEIVWREPFDVIFTAEGDSHTKKGRRAMKRETRTVKELLKSKYPGKKFSVKYVVAANYAVSCDRIQVIAPEDVSVDEVISFIRRHSHGISVTQTGKPVFVDHKDWPEMLYVKNYDYESMGLCECIEVGQRRKAFEIV